MDLKSIEIDQEAYARLRHAQRPDESLSETIKRVLAQPVEVDEWLRSIREHPLSEQAAQAVEEQISLRSVRSPISVDRTG